jgi:putative chitinase
MTITKDQLVKCVGNDIIFGSISILQKYNINTVNRIAGFLAQCGHESNNFTIMKENLNYSAQRLVQVFPKYFKSLNEATPYNRNPDKIASKVYGNRMGNGDETTHDGYTYRGRGFIQLTGKVNYTAFAKSIGKSLADTVAYLETVQGALESACWYWNSRNINTYCDKDDIIGMTKAINGGTIGLPDRTARYNSYKAILSSQS